MKEEYLYNENKQESHLKKYKKAIIKTIIFTGILGFCSTFLFPIGPIFNGLQALGIGEGIARNIAFFTQLGICAGSLGGIISNGIKAVKNRKQVEKYKEDNTKLYLNAVNNNNVNKEDEKEKTNSKELEEKGNVKVDYKELASLYEKQALINLKQLNTDDIEDSKEDIKLYNELLNKLNEIKENKNLSEIDRFERLQTIYEKTEMLINPEKKKVLKQ